MIKVEFTMKEKTRILGVLLLFSFLLLATPLKSSAIRNSGIAALEDSTLATSPNPLPGEFSLESAAPFPDEPLVRVAIYDEPNLTAPSYVKSFGDYNNNITNLMNILSENPQFDISTLTAADIAERHLTTANFDVFIMVDNNPREYIVNAVVDFWLAGGGLLALDSPATFLAYAGILPPESAGDDGYTEYWAYHADEFNFTTRHPISKAYATGMVIPTIDLYTYSSWNRSGLLTSSISADLTPIAHGSNPNEITILAFDPTDRGGKVVSVGFDLDHELIPQLDQLIRDSVSWLAPRPKARIAFDFSHNPRLGIDSWDYLSKYPNYYYEMRDYLVANRFTVDKLYPAASGDNFTYERLQPYDMLFVITNDYNYTQGERLALEAWIADGGSLLVLGDHPFLTFEKPTQQMNMLLAPFGLAINESSSTAAAKTISTFDVHPTTERCENLTLSFFGHINLTGSAYPIWKDGGNVVVAASEYGLGRVILVSDINWIMSPGGYFNLEENKDYLLNVANWLTASKAKVLVFIDGVIGPNAYRTALTLALNDLGIDYYLVADMSHWYFNYSLYHYQWDMVIIDAIMWPNLNFYLDDLSNYLDTGGKLIMSYYNIDGSPSHPLWAKLGFQYNSTFINEPPIYIWDTGHDIFSQPIGYQADNFTVSAPYFDDGDVLTVFDNATALAGLTPTEQDDNAIIVLRNDEQTLYNGYLIDEFNGDIDDSTYSDSFELWKNEIAFMMRPKVNVITYFSSNAAFINETLTFTLQLENNGISAVTTGLSELGLPAGGSTSDSLSQAFTLAPGEVRNVTWEITFSAADNYTLTFDVSYQGFIGTIYHETITVDITVSTVSSSNNTFAIPLFIWYIVGGALGALLLIIIIVVAVVASKKKKGTPPTR